MNPRAGTVTRRGHARANYVLNASFDPAKCLFKRKMDSDRWAVGCAQAAGNFTPQSLSLISPLRLPKPRKSSERLMRALDVTNKGC